MTQIDASQVEVAYVVGTAPDKVGVQQVEVAYVVGTAPDKIGVQQVEVAYVVGEPPAPPATVAAQPVMSWMSFFDPALLPAD